MHFNRLKPAYAVNVPPCSDSNNLSTAASPTLVPTMNSHDDYDAEVFEFVALPVMEDQSTSQNNHCDVLQERDTPQQIVSFPDSLSDSDDD